MHLAVFLSCVAHTASIASWFGRNVADHRSVQLGSDGPMAAGQEDADVIAQITSIPKVVVGFWAPWEYGSRAMVGQVIGAMASDAETFDTVVCWLITSAAISCLNLIWWLLLYDSP